MTGTLSSLGKRFRTLLERIRRHEQKLSRKLERTDEAGRKQQEVLDLAYSRALRVLTSRKKELSRLLDSQLKLHLELAMKLKVGNEGLLQRLDKGSELIKQMNENLGAVSMVRYNEAVERVEGELTDCENSVSHARNAELDLFVFERNINIIDKSEMCDNRLDSASKYASAKFTEKETHVGKDLHLLRAQSTSHKHRRQSASKKEPSAVGNEGLVKVRGTADPPTVSHVASGFACIKVEPVTIPKGRRNGTVSPKRDDTAEWMQMVSPTCSESTAPSSLGVTLLSAKAGMDNSSAENATSGMGEDPPSGAGTARAGTKTSAATYHAGIAGTMRGKKTRGHKSRKVMNHTQIPRCSNRATGGSEDEAAGE